MKNLTAIHTHTAYFTSLGKMVDSIAIYQESLAILQNPPLHLVKCPDIVKKRIADLRVPVVKTSSDRRSFPGGGSSARGGYGSSASGSRGGFSNSHGRPMTGGGSGGGFSNPHGRPMTGGGGSATGGGSGSGSRGGFSGSRGGFSGSRGGAWRPRGGGPRFGNKARDDVTTEERMMDRIREKMNKFSPITYDATKTWLSQLLDSGETEFLDGFITLVFEKAASEASYCALYATLMTDLCGAFTHIPTKLRQIFMSFLGVFTEASKEPDVGTEEYAAFVKLRERRRFRKGYASFIGEIAKGGVGLSKEDICQTCGIIIDQLRIERLLPEKASLCEEYADCLTAIVRASMPLIKEDFRENLLPRVIEAQTRCPEAVSLSNKARFALMDIRDLF